MWTRGIGYHHAGLAPIVKEFIEYLFINKYIKYLFATETLALGVNLPAKSILINNLNKFDGFKTRLINNSEFLQLSGRAGRRGIDTQGFAFLNYDKNVNFEWYKNLFKLKPSILKSAFSVNYSSVIKLNNLYTKEEALNLLNKSFYSLGTDGFGRSDTRKNLRNFFEVDKEHIVTYGLSVLAKEQLIASKYASEAIKKYNIDKNKPMPTKL